MDNFVLSISEDGTLSCLYNEVLDLRELGASNTRRASNVEWDNTSQQWVVTLANGEVLGGWPKRSEAIAAEVDYLNGLIADGTIQDLFKEKA